MILKLGLIIPFLASFLKPIHPNMGKQYLVSVFDSPYLYIDELDNYYIDLSEFEYYFYDNYLIADTYETIDLINDQNVFTIVINPDNLSGYSLVNNDFDFYNVSFDVGRSFINSIINEAKCLNENARKKNQYFNKIQYVQILPLCRLLWLFGRVLKLVKSNGTRNFKRNISFIIF